MAPSLVDVLVALALGVHLTLLALILALRRLTPRPDLTFAWAAWALTLLATALLLLGMLRGDAPPPGAMATPTP